MTSPFGSTAKLLHMVLSPEEAKAFRDASVRGTFTDTEEGLQLTYYRCSDGRIMIDDISPIPVPLPPS